ncbi:FMN-binding protein [Micromonospora fulviviridis]|uniref:FMN-binding protein n=1 Tax=Micromonospora fulviviridis TaxID=47860 RepID=UPI001668F2C7|nr:FMN-binding protein [Micromonospora fulviviridis]GGR81170.1 FMN-binding protein [Micromonospora fulviviridis]
MRRITIWLLSTVAALVLLFSYKTSTMGAGGESSAIASGSDGAGSGSSWTGTDDGSGSSSGGTSSNDGDTSSGNGTSSGGGTATGSVAQTRWGPVQVRITVSNGKITDVTAVQVPDGNHRDQEINDYAVPILRQEALDAQSAQIDTVSGATVTSDGYRESLQSAIDAAHLK